MLMNNNRALGIMKEQGINALIATHTKNINYSKDLEANVPPIHVDELNFAILPAEENLDPTLILATSRLPLVADRPNRIKE